MNGTGPSRPGGGAQAPAGPTTRAALVTAIDEEEANLYVDREVPMLLRMFEKRLRGYRAIGYARGEAPLRYAEPSDERVVEYHVDVLATLDQEDNFA